MIQKLIPDGEYHCRMFIAADGYIFNVHGCEVMLALSLVKSSFVARKTNALLNT